MVKNPLFLHHSKKKNSNSFKRFKKFRPTNDSTHRNFDLYFDIVRNSQWLVAKIYILFRMSTTNKVGVKTKKKQIKTILSPNPQYFRMYMKMARSTAILIIYRNRIFRSMRFIPFCTISGFAIALIVL